MEKQEIDIPPIHQNGQSRPVMLSSNTTLFWRLFIPIFVTSTLTALLVGVWFSQPEDSYFNRTSVLAGQIIFTLTCLGWVIFVRKTIWKLRRVDATDTHIFVTNYWTTARYTWEDVEKIEEKKRLGRRVVNMHLKSPGYFGQIISFLPGSGFDAWRTEKEVSIPLAN